VTSQEAYTAISNCAAAGDGGSLWVELSTLTGTESFMLIRSIVSQGTPAYGSVVDRDGHTLSDTEMASLYAQLVRLNDPLSPCGGLVSEFANAVQQVAQADMPASGEPAA